MKCANCGNKYLSRYRFILSAIFFKNQNSIKCDKCNNLSELNKYELLSIRIITYLFIFGMIFVITTIKKFNYNENIISLFSIALLGLIFSIAFVKLKKDTSNNKTNIYVNSSYVNNINDIKFVFIYLFLLILLSIISFFTYGIFDEMNSFLFIPSITIVFIPMIVSVIVSDIFPEKKQSLIKVIYVRFIILSIISLYSLLHKINAENFAELNLLYFFTIPTIVSFFIMFYIERKLILNEKFTFSLRLGVVLILNFLILSAQPFYIDDSEYYFNIERKGMTIFNKIQRTVSYKVIDKEKLKEAIHYYDVVSKETE